MKLRQLIFGCIFLSLFIGLPYSAAAAELNPGVDMVSRYIWRGKDFGSAPAFQPALTFSCGDFSIGAWGSVTFNDNKFQEQDLFISYSFLDMFSITVTDYFFPNDTVLMNNYFEYDDEITGHILEGTIKFEGTESIPVYAAFNYNFWGWDKDNSMYLEIGYNGKIKDNKFDVFMGMTFDEGIYGDSFGVVNLGLSAYRDIKVSETFTLPVFTRLIFNPQAENIHLVFGLSL